MSDADATFIECKTPQYIKDNKVLDLCVVDLGRKYTHQLPLDETKITHINEQVCEAMFGLTRKKPEPENELGHRTQERTRKAHVAHTTESPRSEVDRKQDVRGRS